MATTPVRKRTTNWAPAGTTPPQGAPSDLEDSPLFWALPRRYPDGSLTVEFDPFGTPVSVLEHAANSPDVILAPAARRALVFKNIT